MQRREFLKAASAGVLGVAEGAILTPQQAQGAAVKGRPNIIIVMCDEHHANMTRLSGYSLDTRPTLDSYAREGVAFDGAYCTSPLCVPSRTSLLTGRWPEAHRVRQNSQPKVAFYEKDIFGVARANGYKTGLAGKNHSYMKPEMHDFWREYSHQSGWKAPDAPKEYADYDKWLSELGLHGVSQKPTPFPLEVQFPYRIVSDAIDFIDQFGAENFALEVSFPEPHNPIQVPKPYFDMFPPDKIPDRLAGPEALKSKNYRWQWMHGLEEDTYPGFEDEWRRYISDYVGMLRLLDDQLARLIDHLKKKGLYDNTIIVCLADHGDFVMEYGMEGKGVGLSEAVTRIPMVWFGGPIRARNPHHQALVSIADVMPTFCDALGVDIPHGVQGRSLWPLLRNEPYPREEFRSIFASVGFGGLFYEAEDHVPYTVAQMAVGAHVGKRRPPLPGEPKTYDTLNQVGQSGYLKMVRMDDWKLIYDMMGYGELYHLSSDPAEVHNLFGTPSVKDTQMRLLEELLTWTIRVQDTLPTGEYSVKWPAKHNWYWPHRVPQ